MTGPTPAPRGFPYVDHRTVAEVWPQAVMAPQRNRSRRNPDRDSRMVEMYRGGATLDQVGAAFGITGVAVLGHFKRLNEPRRMPGARPRTAPHTPTLRPLTAVACPGMGA